MVKYIKADLHNHFSHRSKVLSPARVVERVRETLGESGMVALVNYEDQRYEAFAEAAEKTFPNAINLGFGMVFPSYNVSIIKGQEIPTLEGDLLVLATQEGTHLTGGKSLIDSLRKGEEIGGISIATSPYFRSGVGKELEANPWLMAYLSAIETNNGIATKESNVKAHNLFYSNHKTKRNMGRISASDGHSFHEVGGSYTAFGVPDNFFNANNPESFKQELEDMIRHAPRTLANRTSLRGRIEHGLVIGAMVALSKVGINVSRGDREALR